SSLSGQGDPAGEGIGREDSVFALVRESHRAAQRAQHPRTHWRDLRPRRALRIETMTRLTIPAIVLALVASGCVRAQHFRYAPMEYRSECFADGLKPPGRANSLWPSLDCTNTLYGAAFIEFSEQGRLIEKAQKSEALDLIDRVRQKGASRKIITFIYAHG